MRKIHNRITLLFALWKIVLYSCRLHRTLWYWLQDLEHCGTNATNASKACFSWSVSSWSVSSWNLSQPETASKLQNLDNFYTRSGNQCVHTVFWFGIAILWGNRTFVSYRRVETNWGSLEFGRGWSLLRNPQNQNVLQWLYSHCSRYLELQFPLCAHMHSKTVHTCVIIPTSLAVI